MALTQIALVDGNLCSTNQMCNALECEIGDQRVEMAVDSCHHPPGVRMAVYDSDNNLLYNRSFYNGTHTLQYRNQPVQFIVTVKQLPPSSISVEVHVNVYVHTHAYTQQIPAFSPELFAWLRLH